MNFETEAELREKIKELESRLNKICHVEIENDKNSEKYRIYVAVLKSEAVNFPGIWRELIRQFSLEVKKIYEK